MENDQLDGCSLIIDTDNGETTDEEVELIPLFADALDPNSTKTVEEAEAEWKELFNAPKA